MCAMQMGTLTLNVARAVKEMRAGRCEFRLTRDRQIMTVVGKVRTGPVLIHVCDVDSVKMLRTGQVIGSNQ